MQLPTPLRAPDDAEAIGLVREYLQTDESIPGGVRFTGSLFDTWDGGGDRSEVANRFTDADINAVAMLSVEIPPTAVVEILSRQAGRLGRLLADIPTDVDLHEAPAGLIRDGSAADRLWVQLNRIDGVGWVTTGKLCARKRPHLLPVYDTYVRKAVGAPEGFWAALREALRRDNAALAHRLRRIGDEAGGSHLSLLRVFDIVTWQHERRHSGEDMVGGY